MAFWWTYRQDYLQGLFLSLDCNDLYSIHMTPPHTLRKKCDHHRVNAIFNITMVFFVKLLTLKNRNESI